MRTWPVILPTLIGFWLGIGAPLVQGLELGQVDTFPVQFAQPPQSSACGAQLQAKIASILARPEQLRSHWGILVTGQDAGSVYIAHNPDQLFTPASNAKLFVTSAALLRLGANFRIPTAIYRVKTNTPQPVLVVKGAGDPSLTDRELDQLAQQLAEKGIRQIHRLIADDRAIQGNPTNSTWALEDISGGEITPLTSFIVNRNAMALIATPQALGEPLQLQWRQVADGGRWRIENHTQTVARSDAEFVDTQVDVQAGVVTVRGALHVGSASETLQVPVSDPTGYFLERLQLALARQKISVQTIARLPEAKAADRVLDPVAIATVYSPPLHALIKEINQESDNFYAEALLRVLGNEMRAKQSLAPTTSSADQGLLAVREALAELRVDPEGYRLVDGSGLSRQNLVSPTAIVQLLQAMAKSQNGAVFQASLAKAGASGTLANRFRETAASGQIVGKTGSLTGVSALSGIALPAEKKPLYFSILVNQSNQAAIVPRQAIDDIVISLVRLDHCQG